MKTLKLLFVAFLLLQSSAMFGQERETVPEVHPDLDNPKVQQVQKLIEKENYVDALKLYKEVFQSKNRKNIKDLFVFDMARFGSGRIMDLFFNAEYQTEISQAIKDIMAQGDSPSEKFQKALVYYTAGLTVYKDPEQLKEYLNFPFHTFLQLISNGWKRPISLLPQAATELYKVGFEDEHLSMDLIVEAYDLNLVEHGYTPSIMDDIANGFHYENTYGVPITEEEQKEIDRHNEISTEVTRYSLITDPENAAAIMNELWKRSLLKSSFSSRYASFISGYADSLSSFTSKLEGREDIDYKELKSLDILYQSFYNEDSKSKPADLIELHGDKEKAYKYLEAFLTLQNKDGYLDILGVNPEWVSTFREFIIKSPEKLMFAIRYSDELDTFLSDNSVNIELLEKSLDFMPETIDRMEFMAVMSDNKTEKGLALYALYQLAAKMDKIREQERYTKNKTIRYDQAKAWMAFELTHLKLKGIHSSTILWLNDVFDNWTAEEIRSSSDHVKAFLSEYLEIYTNSKMADASMEKGTVMDILQDLAIEFDLI